jgi:UDP-N-acetylglucosamine:LPS N-acetylglucosamine transferase
MIFISIIPGQEARNAEFIIKNGLGVIPRDMESLVRTVYTWKRNPDILRKIKEKIAKLSFSSATGKILEILQ